MASGMNLKCWKQGILSILLKRLSYRINLNQKLKTFRTKRGKQKSLKLRYLLQNFLEMFGASLARIQS